jgi:ankyrin repeat protein
MHCVLDATKEIIMKLNYSIKNKFLRSIAIGSFLSSIFAGNIFASVDTRASALVQLLKQDAHLKELVHQHRGNINMMLYQLVEMGDMQGVRKLLDLGIKPNKPVNQWGETAMKAAGTLEMIDSLAEHGGNIHETLFQAARENNISLARELLRTRKANPNVPIGLLRATAMHAAHTPKMILLLVDHEGDANPALQYAIRRNDVTLAQALLARGADPHVPVGSTGETAMECAPWRGSPKISPKMIALLRNHSNILLYRAVEAGNVALVQRLLALGTDPNAQVGPNGETARDLAHRMNNPEMIALFAPHK